MSYQSPIELMVNELHTLYEDNIVKAVQEYNITVNKDELLMALQYDRAQYDKGYSDGRFDRDREIVRCKDCKWYYDDTEYCDKWGDMFIYWSDHSPVPPNGYCFMGEKREDG